MSKIIGPDIIEKRIATRSNPWNWVVRINNELSKNTINPDDSIDVMFEENIISDFVLGQVIEHYQSVNWVITSTIEGGFISLNFKAPEVTT